MINETIVYAGAATDYETPSLDAIGSNAGDLVHGYGLYYAKNPKTANQYKNTSKGVEWLYNEEPFLKNLGKYTKGSLTWEMIDLKDQLKIIRKNTPEQVVKALKTEIQLTLKDWKTYEPYKEDCKNLETAIEFLDDIDMSKLIKKDMGIVGKFRVPQDEYLLSESSFKAQSPYVKECLKKMCEKEGMNLKELKNAPYYCSSSHSEGSIYSFVVSFLSGQKRYELIGEEEVKYQKEASELLYKYGIKGIRYIGKKDGKCVVIFNPNDVQMIDKMKETMNEKLEELSDGIYATQSAYDILNLFKNKPKAYRVVYDKNNRYYFIGDALKYIHSDLISAAYNQGFYYDDIQSNSRHDIMMYLGNALEFVEVLMLSFFPKDFGDIKALDNERSSDWYNHKYVYDFGTIYTQEHCPLEEFDFYRLLGEPLEQEELELPESLNERFEEIESGIYATQSAYDLLNWLKNKPKAYRVVYDENIRYYFIADAYSYIHQDILESAYRSGFYPEMFSEDEIRDYIDDGMNLDMINKKPFLLFFAFSPNSDKNLDLEKSSDGYTRKYTYDFGSIYAHELTPLEDFDLYQLLKEPISKETIYENLYAKLCEDLSKFL